MTHRSAVLAANALISTVLIAAILAALNYLGAEHHVRWDLTATREHSLSPQTIKVLRSLPGPVQVVAFPRSDAAAPYRQMLATYAYYSKDFQYRLVDPDRNPTEAQKYKVTSYGQIVFQYGKSSYTADDDTEEQLTNSLLHVLQTTKKAVYALQGEGEIPLDDFTRSGMGTVKQALTGKGFDVKTLFLSKESRVPDDAAAVLVAAPTKDLLPQELNVLTRYYQTGGKLLVLVDPETPADVRAWLASAFHVQAPGGLVIDPLSRLAGVDPAAPVITQYPYNDITQNFTLVTVLPLSTPLVPDAKTPGVTINAVAKSSDASYVKVNLNTNDIRFDPKVDRKGPAMLAVEVIPAPGAPAAQPSPEGSPAGKGAAAAPTAKAPPQGAPAPQGAGPAKPPAQAAPAPPGPKGSAVIYGSAFVRNAYVGLSGNLDLFTSSVAWLTQSGNLVSIAPRASPFDAFFLTGNQARILALGSVIGLPLVLLVIGGSIYFRRRAL